MGLQTKQGMPQVLKPPPPSAAPEGAAARWEAQFDDSVQMAGSSRWLSTIDAEGIDSSAARDWVREQRTAIIDHALFATAANVPRLDRRSASLQDTGVDQVYVLPLDGRYAELHASGPLLVSLATFLDDAEWGQAIESLGEPSR